LTAAGRQSRIFIVRRSVSALAVATALSAGLPGSAVGQDSLTAVLARAGEYVTTFQRELAGIVAEEHYEQTVHDPYVFRRAGHTVRPEDLHRILKSDLLLVRPQGINEWVQFRDVFEVDGNPVRDRSDRLVNLFLNPSVSTAEQVRMIVLESARYNIGNIVRTINVPILPLSVLDPANQPRFRFERDESSKNRITIDNSVVTTDLPQTPRFRVSTDVWVIRYNEVRPRTLIHTTAGRDLPSHGRLWVEPSTGRVLMSELVAGDASVEGQIEVSYQSQPLLGLLVPIEMRETYHVPRDQLTVDGTATYSNFRRFQVKVDEKLGPIKEKPQTH
jgi:hypothetical protein